MQNQKGIIGIVILIVVALIVGGLATYWYVGRGIPDAPAPLNININDVPSPTGPAGTYQPLVPPEPKFIDPNLQEYEQDEFGFTYPTTWETSIEPDGVLIRDKANASSTINITNQSLGFPADFKECLASSTVVVQEKDVTIHFLCDTSKSAKDKNRVWVVADTMQGYAFFGTASKDKKEDVNRAAYIDIFSKILASFEVK